MQLNDTLARQIVSRAMKILSFSVNVMDEHGLIIASGNPERLHQRHEGAVLALTENRVVEISDATARELKGVRPGSTCPSPIRGSCSGSSASRAIRTKCALTPSWCA
ncbi:Carbohydrate diacid regulator [Aeromonas dhakensis]